MLQRGLLAAVILAASVTMFTQASISAQSRESERAQRFFTAGPITFALTDFVFDTLTVNFLSNGGASTIAGVACSPAQGCDATIFGTLVPAGDAFRMATRWVLSADGTWITVSCNIDGSGAGLCFSPSHAGPIGISVRSLAGDTAASGRSAIDDLGAEPRPVLAAQRGITSGPLSFRFSTFCDVLTLNFLSNGVASTLAGVSVLPPGCNETVGVVAGSLVPNGTGSRMALHWIFSRGGELVVTCDVSAIGSGPCRDDRGRQFDVSLAPPPSSDAGVPTGLPGAFAGLH